MVKKIIACLALGLSSCASSFSHPPLIVPANSQVLSINWILDEQAALMAAKQNNKSMLIYFYADWCGYCNEMQATTLKDPRVVTLINDEYVSLKVNVDTSTLDDRVGVKVYPTTIVISPAFERGRVLEGYVNADQLIEFLAKKSYEQDNK